MHTVKAKLALQALFAVLVTAAIAGIGWVSISDLQHALNR
jgi:hypothetical protein